MGVGDGQMSFYGCGRINAIDVQLAIAITLQVDTWHLPLHADAVARTFQIELRGHQPQEVGTRDTAQIQTVGAQPHVPRRRRTILIVSLPRQCARPTADDALPREARRAIAYGL